MTYGLAAGSPASFGARIAADSINVYVEQAALLLHGNVGAMLPERACAMDAEANVKITEPSVGLV